MKPTFLFGTLALMAALVLIINRTTLAGTTITNGDVSVTERNEPLEIRLFWLGSILGGGGVVVILVGLFGSKRTP